MRDTMKTLSWNEQIEYLIKSKFPYASLVNIPTPLSKMGKGGISESHRQKLSSDVSDFKQTLLKKSRDEIKVLYETEKNKEIEAFKLKLELEEHSRFFHQQSANADFTYWSKMAHWSLDEAIALSFGKNPEIVNWGKVGLYTQVSPFAKEYENRRNLALRAIPWGKLYDPMLPSIFLGWAKELNLVIPEFLIIEIEKTGYTAINWFERYQELKKEHFKLIASYEEKLVEASHIQQSNANNVHINITPLLELAINASMNFFIPRKSVDAKKEEVVEWVVNNGQTLTPPVSVNIAEAIFTIIRPTDHNPRKRR